MTEALYGEDPRLRSCEARIVAVRDGAALLDRTVFFAQGGGQPGDSGVLRAASGAVFTVVNTVKGEDGHLHQLAPDAGAPQPGETVTAEIDWPRRWLHMRMHSALHLLCACVEGDVTGGQIGAERSRLDFDIPSGAVDKAALSAMLNALVARNEPIRARWITEAELDAQPELVRTLSVRPPRGEGRVRLIAIEGIDLQPCGGTHVARTGEIGRITVAKIENKGRQNRRIAITLS